MSGMNRLPMSLLRAIFGAAAIACTGCTATNSSRDAAQRSDEYVPSFDRLPEGFRPILPIYHAETTFWKCENLSAAQLGDIRDHFTNPIGEGRYYQHIGAVVVNGYGEDCQITFTIWLFDGRRLDSGHLFMTADGEDVRSDFDPADRGRPMYRRAGEMLKKAISKSQIERAEKNAHSRPSTR